MQLSADLHCHTRLSDGSLGIEDLITLAKKRGVETLAITDHDCLAGCVRGKVVGDRLGVNVIPAVELSATDTATGQEVHLIAYKSDFPDRLEGLCRRNSLKRKRAAHIMMLKVAKLFPISTDLVIKCMSGSTNIYKQHIMHALMECGFTDRIYGELYMRLFSQESKMNVLMNPKYEDVKTVLEYIQEAGGIAVLAHPNRYKNKQLLDELVSLGLDGVEAYLPEISDDYRDKLLKYAKKNKLLVTGGSNFKGFYNKHIITLGEHEIPKECLQELVGYKTKMRKLQKKAQIAVNTVKED